MVCQRNELNGNISPAILKCIVNQRTWHTCTLSSTMAT